VAEENVGIWRYGADPTDGTDPATDRVLVDSTDLTGHLVKDVEGVAIAYDVAGSDYLFASSQGNSTYTVYRRGEDGAFAFFQSFKVDAAESGIDGTQETDGIDVTSASLGPDFPGGLFVAQDGVNGAENQNYKLVPLGSVLPDAP
jgi:3-phytase